MGIRLLNSIRDQAGSRRRRSRPVLEPLEDRMLLYAVTGGTWTWNYYRVTAVNAGGQESPPTADVGGYKTC